MVKKDIICNDTTLLITIILLVVGSVFMVVNLACCAVIIHRRHIRRYCHHCRKVVPLEQELRKMSIRGGGSSTRSAEDDLGVQRVKEQICGTLTVNPEYIKLPDDLVDSAAVSDTGGGAESVSGSHVTTSHMTTSHVTTSHVTGDNCAQSVIDELSELQIANNPQYAPLSDRLRSTVNSNKFTSTLSSIDSLFSDTKTNRDATNRGATNRDNTQGHTARQNFTLLKSKDYEIRLQSGVEPQHPHLPSGRVWSRRNHHPKAPPSCQYNEVRFYKKTRAKDEVVGSSERLNGDGLRLGSEGLPGNGLRSEGLPSEGMRYNGKSNGRNPEYEYMRSPQLGRKKETYVTMKSSSHSITSTQSADT